MILGVPILKHFGMFSFQFSDVCIAMTQAVPPGQCSVPKLQGKPKATSLHLRWGRFIEKIIIFSSPVQMYRKSYCTTPCVGIGGCVDKMLKFYVKVFM